MATERVLATVGDVEEAVFVLEIRVDLAHGRGGLRYGFIDEQEDGLFGWQLDAFAYDPHELGDRDVVGHEELALVNLGDLRVGNSLDHDLRAGKQLKWRPQAFVQVRLSTYWDSIWVLGPDLLRFGLSLLYKESKRH